MYIVPKTVSAGLLLSGAATSAQARMPEAPQKPNIVYIIADQLRWDALGYTGNAKAVTLNIDRFAAQALDFTEAVSSTPVSAAHRACLITGKYQSSTGMVINEINLNPNHRTWAHVLGDAGYKLGYVGKHHWTDLHRRDREPGPERMGFDDYWAAYSFNHKSYNAFYHTEDGGGIHRFVELKGRYGPEVFTSLALDYIRKKAAAGEPFAMMLSWNPPHDPWVRSNVDPRCYERFRNVHFDLPENFKRTPDPYMDRYPQQFFDGEEKWRGSFIDTDRYSEMLRCYYAMVNSLDEQFGRVMDLLEELGIADNTIVVFTSDHGEQFGSQGRMYKLTFYDESAHIPFLIRDPRYATGGRESDACLNTPDIGPTLLGLAGLHGEIPDEMEGEDLSFIVRGEKGREPEYAFMQSMGHTYQWKDGYEWRAVRSKRYTYARYLRDGSEVLLDREADPTQLTNYAGDPAYASVKKELRKRMERKMKQLGDDFKPCSWYRDRWMYKGYSIKASARGEFGPLPPVEPKRTE